MPVTETLMNVGQWSLTLSPNTPRSIIDSLEYFQHVVISTGRSDPRVAGNSLFSSGRYTGVVTGLDFQSLKAGRGPVISGDGMATWLGTPKGVGPVIENATLFTTAGIATVVNTLRPSCVGAGTIYSIPGAGTYTGGFVWKTPRDALTSFAQQVTKGPLPTQIVEWRVNGNCTLDFGPVASLYRTTPVCAIVPKSPGVDMAVRGLDGVAQTIEDVKDLTTRVVVLASGSGSSTAVGTANAADVGAAIPYTDFFGNPVQMTRMVSASSVSSYNATAAAQSALIPYTTPADQVRLSSSEYDIKGDLQVGDYVWLYDPDAGFVDYGNQLVFRGERINPTKQRLIEATWPVVDGMSVAYRDQAGAWHDLTDYVVWETGTTNLVVGGYNRNLVPTSEPVGPRPQPDTTIPGVPAFGAFTTASYLSDSNGHTRSQIQLTWSTPTNTDGTTMTDLDHYEIQYRPDLTISSVNPSWQGLNSGGYTWAQLTAMGSTYNQIYPLTQTDWKVTFVAGGVNQLLVQELTPGVTYDFQIRAVDTAQPPNRGAWSATTTFQAAVDTQPPPTPDAPTVAANMASVQISWDCGSASGGAYNQAADLHHIEVHGSYDPLFQPTNSTKLGNLPASIANITGQIPVVGSFTIPPGQPPAQAMYIKIVAVDTAGNKSNPSASAGASAVLWSNAYITDLSVSKLTAGTITADVVVGGTIATALSGVRAGMDPSGLWCYDAAGDQTFLADAATGHVELSSSGSGQRVSIRTGVDLSAYAAPASTDAIVMYPDGATLHPPVLASYDLSTGGNALSAFSGIVSDSVFGTASTYAYVMSLQGSTSGGGNGLLAYIDVGSNKFNGGAVQVASTFAFVGLANEAAVAGGSVYQLNSGLSSTDVAVEAFGYTYNRGGSAPAANDLTFGGSITGNSAGLSSLAWGYGVTLASGAVPVCQYSCGNTSVQPGTNISANGTTGFTLSLSAAAPASWSVFFSVTRYR